jgi:hypothetical protein
MTSGPPSTSYFCTKGVAPLHTVPPVLVHCFQCWSGPLVLVSATSAGRAPPVLVKAPPVLVKHHQGWSCATSAGHAPPVHYIQVTLRQLCVIVPDLTSTLLQFGSLVTSKTTSNVFYLVCKIVSKFL